MATAYDFIAQNRLRTWLLVLLFPLTFALLGYFVVFGYHHFNSATYASYYEESEEEDYQALGGSYDETFELANRTAVQVLPWLWAAAMLWILAAYYLGDSMLLNGAGAREIYPEDQPEIYRLVENLCIAAGLPMPKVYIINDTSLNAFATGRDPEHASVALTVGIVNKLERAELEGVVAHELSHIQNRDIRLMLITVAGISFFTFLSEVCFRTGVRSSMSRERDKGSGAFIFFALGTVFAIYGYLIAPLIRLAISRTREYQADASAALLTRNPGALARALEKISIDPKVEALDDHASMAAMCIENPLSKMGLFAEISGMFSTHPPIEERIAALREMDGEREMLF